MASCKRCALKGKNRCNDKHDVHKFLIREVFIIYGVLRNFQELRTVM